MGAARSAQYLVDRVREFLNEFAPAPFRDGFTTDPETVRTTSILRTINAVVTDIARDTAYYKKTFNVSARNGVWEIPIPVDCLEIQWVRYSGTHLERLQGGEQTMTEEFPAFGSYNPHAGLPDTSSGITIVAGYPRFWAQRDATTIVVHPVPSGATSSGISAFQVNGVSVEPDLVNPTDTLAQFPTGYIEDVPIVAAYMLALTDPENPAMVQRAASLAPLAAESSKRLGIYSKFRSLEMRRRTTASNTPAAPSDAETKYE